MAEAKFISGRPDAYVPYTTDANTTIVAGQVVVLGDCVYVAHDRIPPSTTGSLANGGGVYEVIANTAITGGRACYWVDANNKVNLTTTNNERFGFSLPNTNAADGDKIHVYHSPGPGT